MSKIKVLVVSNDANGVGYYRINSPYLSINDSDIDIKFVSSTDFTFRFNENVLKDFNILVYHKSISFRVQENLDNFDKTIKKYGIKVIYDIDDYWDLPTTHMIYKIWKDNNTKQVVINKIKSADYVTTTTPIIADYIKDINNNVVVLENAINHKEQQWSPNKIESDKTRFIWGGGVSHLHDLNFLTNSFKSIDKKTLNEIQVYMCGFDLRTANSNKPIPKSNVSRSTWSKFESIFTNKFRLVNNPQYLRWLREYTDGSRDLHGYNEEFKDEFYQRRWTKSIFTYGEMYNEADVALAPLLDNKFNAAKSQLKVLEAGIHNMPIIASNVGPYTLDIVDGVNGFLIDNNDSRGWLEKMKFFKENPQAVKDMGSSLNELILEKYTLEKINKKRAEFLKSIV